MSLPLKVTQVALTLSLFTNTTYSIDDNDNGLSDVWEQRYNASALELLGDDDGDGFKNIEECIAGTDPYNADDRPELKPLVVKENSDEIELTFDTLIGKSYTVLHSRDLNSFNVLPPEWSGDGVVRTVTIETDALGQATTKYPIVGKYWANTNTDAITDLTDLETFPFTPDGIANHSQPEAPNFIATGYGAQISTWITPPQSGTYTFFLSSSGPAELHFSEQPESTDVDKIAEVLATQPDIRPDDWENFGTQRALPVTLSSEARYQIELRYVGKESNQHVQIGWSGPGLTGIEVLSSTHIADLNFQPNAASGVTLFNHDYDSADQTGTLWPNNTTLVTGTSDMTGNAERIDADIGSSSEERAHFPATRQHLYTSFLFNMAIGVMPQDNYLYFMNGDDSTQEGPRIDIEDSGGTLAVVRAGGSNGNDEQIEIEWGQTYRIEMLASLSEDGFSYQTPSSSATVAQDTFDLYVSATNGDLIGSATGLAFRDGASVVEQLSSIRLVTPNNPNIIYDDWEITSGLIAGHGYLPSNLIDFHSEGSGNFFKVTIEEQDQDNDGIPDWEERSLAAYNGLLFFDAETIDGTPDTNTLTNLLTGANGLPHITLFGSDACAMESNYPNTIPDNGEITITREGVLTPLTVALEIIPLENTGSTTTICDGTCCIMVGTAGDEAAEIEDYQLIDEDGNVVTDTLHFAFGETEKVLTVIATNDAINEYPETLNIGIGESTDGSYTTSELTNGATIQIFDLPDNPDNVTIFTGTFSQDGKAVVATSGSGFVTATLNGTRTELRIWDEFSGLTSAQQDSHVHKSNDGGPGPIIYEITETPGDPETDPLNGSLVDYPWDLNDSSGAVPSSGGAASRQVIIDSLFGQNGESPLYLNVHTVDNPAGEIWAFFNVSGGSATDPGEPTAAAVAGSTDYPQLTGELLESEVRRFLNQATFGATDEAVAALVTTIETERLTDPSYHRNQAYSDWIDDQMNPAVYNQTYLLDLTLAAHFQLATLAGFFDPLLNPTDGETPTPIRPASWPTIDRSDSNPEHWYLETAYPFNDDELDLADDNSLRYNDGNDQRRHAHWQTMLNANDQLRQKMGFALQQIVVVSASADTIRDNAYGSANYQDMLNTHAFSHYRDILGYVNWSPIMGRWLSSLENQKAIDFDGDGLFDSYPDENLARENMQLFSIGLFQIWPDGTLKLSSEGLPQPTYTNDDIREFAKILTGQSFSQYASYSTIPTWGGVPFVADNESFDVSASTNGPLARSYLYPMKMFGDYHSLGTKTFAGTTIDNTSITDPTLQGIADIESAIDWLAGVPGDGKPDYDMVNSHVSTPAFISRRLIQRFVTSNPSTDYLHRVADVFKDSEGDLGLTLKALLLDPEARTIDLNDHVFGMKKSPLEGYLQMLRALQAYTYLPLKYVDGTAPYEDAVGDYTNADLYLENFNYPADQLANHQSNVRFTPSIATTSSGTQGLQMDPFRQPTVFNFYLPDFSPGGAIGELGLVAPELQLANEQDIIRNINYFHDIIRYSPGPGADELGGTDAKQNLAFGFVEGETVANNHDQQRLPFQQMAIDFYPSIEPDSGLTTEATGYTESASGTSSASTPHWVRLSRTGDVFIASESTDGVTWTEINTQVLPMHSEVFIGLALTSHADGTLTTAEFSNISLTGGDGTWYNTDIGAVAASGTAISTGADSFEIQASGSDIWGSADEFHFAYQQLDGDGAIIARVDSLQVTHDWAKAGVMIRETLAANSANVISYISGSYGTRAQIRRVPRGRSSESFADEALLDELDRRLTNGLFKLRYPYDTSDNDDPTVHGLDDLNKNPRELIIDSVHGVYGDPYDGSNDEANRIDKLENILYLLTFTPEYQVKK